MNLVGRLATVSVACVAGAVSGCAPGAPAGPPRILTVGGTAPHRLFLIAPARGADSIACAPAEPPDSAVAYQRAETDSRYRQTGSRDAGCAVRFNESLDSAGYARRGNSSAKLTVSLGPTTTRVATFRRSICQMSSRHRPHGAAMAPV